MKDIKTYFNHLADKFDSLPFVLKRDVDKEVEILEQDAKEFTTKRIQNVRDINLEIHLIVAALVIMMLELIYLKGRGDL